MCSTLYTLVDPSMVGLKLEVCGHAKHIPLSDAMQDGLISCDKVRHFAVEVSQNTRSMIKYLFPGIIN